jgi:transcriptional regulator with XRE-family HTH domain
MANVPPNQLIARAAARAAAKARTRLIEDIERLMADAGVSPAALAQAAGLTHGYVSKILTGKADPTIETYAKLAVPLGANLATRLYPNTGPLIRDRHQAPIVEALLRLTHPRWRASTEAGVTRPARGWIDVVLHETRERLLIAVEIESDIRRIEQQVRWARLKADSLPSWDGWPTEPDLRVSQLLIVRRTLVTRQTALEFGRQLATAYPAHPQDALAALTGTLPWAGNTLIWAHIEGGAVRFPPTR